MTRFTKTEETVQYLGDVKYMLSLVSSLKRISSVNSAQQCHCGIQFCCSLLGTGTWAVHEVHFLGTGILVLEVHVLVHGPLVLYLYLYFRPLYR